MFTWPTHLAGIPLPPIRSEGWSPDDSAASLQVTETAWLQLCDLVYLHDEFPLKDSLPAGILETEAGYYRFQYEQCLTALCAAQLLSLPRNSNPFANSLVGLPGYLWALVELVSNTHKDEEDFPGLVPFPDKELRTRRADVEYLKPVSYELATADQAYATALASAALSAETLSTTAVLISQTRGESHALVQHWAQVAALIFATHGSPPNFTTIWG